MLQYTLFFKMWASLSNDLWKLIPLRDGRDVARARATCRKWRAGIEKVKRLMKMELFHYVRVAKISQLNGGKRAKMIKSNAAEKFMTGILWTFQEFNTYVIDTVKRAPDDFLRSFGWEGESGTYHIERDTNDLLILNDYYGPALESIPDEYMDGMRHLSETFQGTFDWRLIQFPFKLHNESAAGRGFHRGWCWMVRFKNEIGRASFKGIGKVLRRNARRRSLTPKEESISSFMIQNAQRIKQLKRMW